MTAYDQGRLIVAIPFVCKVLDHASKSRVFRPPNPWTMAIIRLLVELYQSADLRMNLKFEVEVLLKAFKLEVKEIEPTTLIKARQAQLHQQQQLQLQLQQQQAAAAIVAQQQQSAQVLSQSQQQQQQLQLLQQQQQQLYATLPPIVKRIVQQATETTIRDIVQAVVERSAKIASIATRDMILKDFAAEGDENKMRKAAHLMAQHLASALALVACKDPFRLNVGNHLRSLFASAGSTDAAMLEQAMNVACSDTNVEVASTIMERSAAEKAIRDIDDELTQAYLLRKRAREQGKQYYDATVPSARFASALPEALRAKPVASAPQQVRVYEDFARPAREAALSVVAASAAAGSAVGATLPGGATGAATGGAGNEPSGAAGSGNFIMPGPNDPAAVATRALNVLFEHPNDAQRDQCVMLLDRLAETSPRFAKDISLYALGLIEEPRIHMIAPAVALVRQRLLSATEIVRTSERRLRQPGVSNAVMLGQLEFILKFLQLLLGDDATEVALLPIESDLATAIDSLTQCTRLISTHLISQQVSEDLALLCRRVRLRPAFVPMTLTQFQQQRQLLQEQQGLAAPPQASADVSDLAESRTLMSQLFDEWIICTIDPSIGEKTHQSFVARLFQPNGVFTTDDSMVLFVRVCIDRCYTDYMLSVYNVFQSVEAFARLISLAMKWHPETTTSATKLQLLYKTLAVLVLIMTNLSTKQAFQQRVFYRLVVCLFGELTAPERSLDGISVPILVTLADFMHAIRPSRLPAFAFAWLELVAHKLFMPKLLMIKNQKGWPLFQRLLVDHLKFLAPYLRTAEMNEPVRLIYRGTLRVLLVLLHDFPEFLCDYHFSFCDVIPPTSIQLRNLILSAFPRNMRLPDPFTPNLKVDLLPEINQHPHVLVQVHKALVPNNLL